MTPVIPPRWAAQSSETASKPKRLGLKSWLANRGASKSQNNPPANASESISAPLPSQATPAGSDPTGDPAPPATDPAALSQDPGGFCWPKDLQNRLPYVQILLYGYEADVLSLSKSHPQHKYRSIHSNTRRVVFMGTPHRGSDVAGLATILANITKVVFHNPNKGLLRGLDSGSEVLGRIHTSFMQLLIKPDFGIHCFQEDRGVTWVSGLTSLIVDDQSSKTGSPHETCETIAANHMDMVKYSGPADDNYRQVSEALESFVDEIIKSSPAITPLDLLTASLPQDLYRNPEAARHIDSRDLDWFFESPEFNQWNSRDFELLWLSGIPGSGKTTLSFYLWDHLKRNRTYTDTGDIVIFFCSTLFGIRSTAESQIAQVLAKIISQLLHSDQKRLELVVQQCPMPELLRQRIPISPSQPFLNGLWKILSASVVAVPSRPVIIIIDGIEVLRSEEARQMFLQNLLQLKNEVKSKGVRGSKIFITSVPFHDIKKALTGVLNIEKDKERQECLRTLKFDELSARRDRVEPAHAETGGWLRNDVGYVSWDSSHSSGLLLIRGKPGSGKSTLAKFILNSLKSKYGVTESDSGEKKDVLIADFFYSFRGGKTETSHRLMLQSILHQLLSQDDRLFPLFRDRFRARRRDGHQVHWQYEDLRKILASLVSLKTRQKIYILLDAMDESNEQGRPEILRLLMQLCSSKSDCAIKGLIATRPLPQGEIDERSSDCHVIILQERNRKDIENFITSGLQAIENSPGSPLVDFSFVKAYMMQKADGVFIWVALVLRELKELVSEGCSQEELETRLKKLPTELADMYRLIIRGLVNRPKHPVEDSVKKGIKMLNWATFAERPLTTEEFRDTIAVPSVPTAFNPDSNFLSRTRVPRLDLRIRSVVVPSLKSEAAARSGYTEVVKLLIELHTDINGRDGASGVFALLAAGDNGHRAVVRLLVDSGADVNAEHESKGTALYRAAAEGHEAMVRLLVDSGADVNAKDESGRTALHKAAAGGQEAVVLLLVDRGADVNAMDESGGTALHKAAAGGHEAVVRLLVNRGAYVNAMDEFEGATLHQAAAGGHEVVVRLLVDSGADVNAEDESGGTALHLAAAGGHEAAVRLLVDHGADINTKNEYRVTALREPVAHDGAADGRVCGGGYTTALPTACARSTSRTGARHLRRLLRRLLGVRAVRPEDRLARCAVVVQGRGNVRWHDYVGTSHALGFFHTKFFEGVPLPPHVMKSLDVANQIELAERRRRLGETIELLPMIQTNMFAMIPIATPSGRVRNHDPGPQPLPSIDYAKSAQQVFVEAAHYIVLERQDLLLRYGERPPCARRLRGFPSWVPHFGADPAKGGAVGKPNRCMCAWWDALPKRFLKPITVSDDGDNAPLRRAGGRRFFRTEGGRFGMSAVKDAACVESGPWDDEDGDGDGRIEMPSRRRRQQRASPRGRRATSDT
ncbi:hypothetical protein DL768_004979 [Monosporascus sp. mg162]|nr:hypothetical protein DL768_004979 [Monosporascus sp. mg162]